MKVNTMGVTALAAAFATLVALTVAPARAFGQEGNATAQQQNAVERTRSIGDGQKATIEGIVIKLDPEGFTVRGTDGAETIVVLTSKTGIKTVRKRLFRSDKVSNASEIVRGLRLSVEGRGNSGGQLVARKVRFDEQDLRTAQSVESRVDPVEAEANTTQALAEANQKRIGAVEENAQILSGQVDELSSVAIAARTAANNAQTTADKAQADANAANERISSLDDYDVLQSITVQFKPGSAVLSHAAKAKLDEAAQTIQNENFKGWVLAIVGYADSTGNTTRNRSLSQRRANAVINYLVREHDLPMRRLIQPFGYGSANPVASNDTEEGRALNRRAEIRVMVNKGIASHNGSPENTGVVQLTNLP
jgi:OmpA-OmpF porin, OOP family